MTSSHNAKTRAVFSVFDATLDQATPDVLGIWTVLSSTATTERAFDTTASANEAVPCWRANFPADLHVANRCLCAGETRLLCFQQALLKVADRLTSIEQGKFSNQAFSASAEENLLQPEAELFRLLHILQGPLPSFGIGECVSDAWNKITEQFQAWTGSLLQAVAHYAWVETYVGEQLIGRTSVSWTGDMQTAWRAELDPAQKVLHLRTLDLALASRNTAIQIFLLVAQSSVKVSVLFTIPGGPLLVIPVVWQFVQRVLAEDKEA